MGFPARAARFLSECSILLFRAKLTRQQHAVFQIALAMTDVETAVALCKAAAKQNDELLSAQSRIYAATIATTGPLPSLIERDNNVPPLAELVAEAHHADAILARFREAA